MSHLAPTSRVKLKLRPKLARSSTWVRPPVTCRRRWSQPYATTSTGGSDNRRIAVIGGGLTGLTTAYYLAKRLPSTVRITLYEASDRLGGWIQTDRVPVDVSGVRGTVSFERGARTLSSLHSTCWRFDDLVLYDLALDLGLEISSPRDQPRHIYYPDHLVTMPPHASLLDCAREPLFLSTLWAALGFAVRRLRPAAPPAEDLSISDWLYRLSGSRALGENLASAMVHGIYGGDIDKLSARSVLDRAYWAYYLAPSAGGNKNNNTNNVRQMPARELALMRELSRDELIRSLALRARGALLHFDRDGMESLPRALEHALRSTPNVDIVTGRPVDELRYDAATDQVEVCAGQKTKENNQGQGQGQGSSPSSYDRVIATITSEALARITADKLPSLADTRSVSVMTVNMWYPRQGLKPRGFGYLIPRSVPREQNPERALGVFFDSDIGARTSVDEPHGTKLFVLMGGHYYESGASPPPPPSEAVAVEQAKSLLERHLGIPASTPCFALARLARDCIPQHHVGHHDRMVQADQELRDAFAGRLAVAGGSYTKIGAMAALRAGYDIAKQTVSGSSSNGGGDEGDDGWRTTGLEQFEFAGDIVDVPVREITVRRPSRRRR